MKAKILTRFNALLTFLLGLLGFGLTDCAKKYGVPVEYGVPHATLEVNGKVTGEDAEPLENIRVVANYKFQDSKESLFEDVFTDENGNYQIGRIVIMPRDSIDIIATDTSGVYDADSVRVGVTYDRSNVSEGDRWNKGAGVVYHDFQLKKNNNKTN